MILALCHCTFPLKPLYGIDYVFLLLKLGKLIAFLVSLHNWNNLQLENVLNEYSGQTFVSLENFSFTKERFFSLTKTASGPVVKYFWRESLFHFINGVYVS